MDTDDEIVVLTILYSVCFCNLAESKLTIMWFEQAAAWSSVKSNPSGANSAYQLNDPSIEMSVKEDENK